MLASTQPHQTKRAIAYDALRSSIMRCELRPGQRLIIDDISRQLGISQIPVREALQQLQSERLVVNVPHIGATVSSISPADVAEVFALMEGLESVAVEQAAANASPQFLDTLDRMVGEMDVALTGEDGERWAMLNSEFHRLIATGARMPLLLDMTQRTLDQWDRVRRFFNIFSQRVGHAQSQHHQIAAAFRAHDIEALRRLSSDHNRDALNAYVHELRVLAEPESSTTSPAAND
ncbi:MAG: Transcriptional regulator, GntR family [uncultured Thermomicrobiales bacterium]|uniref:Transcriptional regulator, GntR family n=1 Tax=uncultured Thermomicrobiales bacterium TaxID=1645740 RepID=A0A6J4V3D1_9BACT|nr:MAG: Transcriptional regulator, GntR family [uncultured Thermomicrobiales bacterium]